MKGVTKLSLLVFVRAVYLYNECDASDAKHMSRNLLGGAIHLWSLRFPLAK